MMNASGASWADGALPPPLAGEGWGEGVSAIENPQEERALTRAFGATSPASGRAKASSRLVRSSQRLGVKA